ncbi:hypothetical protein AB1N83_002923 [Pleurotus pulmonarius]
MYLQHVSCILYCYGLRTIYTHREHDIVETNGASRDPVGAGGVVRDTIRKFDHGHLFVDKLCLGGPAPQNGGLAAVGYVSKLNKHAIPSKIKHLEVLCLLRTPDEDDGDGRVSRGFEDVVLDLHEQ